jgi:hypothetical protein
MTSYYAPTIPLTVDISYDVPAVDPAYIGEQHDILVACDHSRLLYCFRDGAVAWTKSMPNSWPRGLDAFEGLLFYADGQDIVVANPKTGFEHKRQSLGAVINGIKVTRYADVTYVTVCFDTNATQNVKVYTWASLALTSFFTNPHSAAYPRCAFFYAGWLFIADTFGHRVYAADKLSGGMRNSTQVYYPNYIEPIAADQVRICAEHENRVFVWDYSPTDTRTMELCAPVAPYNDITKTRDEIIALESGTGVSPGYTPPKSACAKEYAGSVTLYSQNSATMTPYGLLVADTDNHRVILVRGGVVVAEITGFNNPVTAVMA